MDNYAYVNQAGQLIFAGYTFTDPETGEVINNFCSQPELMKKYGFKLVLPQGAAPGRQWDQLVVSSFQETETTIQKVYSLADIDKRRLKIVVDEKDYASSSVFKGELKSVNEDGTDGYTLFQKDPVDISAVSTEGQAIFAECIEAIMKKGKGEYVCTCGYLKQGDLTVSGVFDVLKDPDEDGLRALMTGVTISFPVSSKKLFSELFS